MDDTISRRAAIDKFEPWLNVQGYSEGERNMLKAVLYELKFLPSAQTEVIRCKDCKYSDENWRRVSVRWLPCMDVRTGSNWFCGSAERRE